MSVYPEGYFRGQAGYIEKEAEIYGENEKLVGIYGESGNFIFYNEDIKNKYKPTNTYIIKRIRNSDNWPTWFFKPSGRNSEYTQYKNQAYRYDKKYLATGKAKGLSKSQKNLDYRFSVYDDTGKLCCTYYNNEYIEE